MTARWNVLCCSMPMVRKPVPGTNLEHCTEIVRDGGSRQSLEVLEKSSRCLRADPLLLVVSGYVQASVAAAADEVENAILAWKARSTSAA